VDKKTNPPPSTDFTPREKQLAELLRKDPDMTQSEMARRLGISRQRVSAQLKKMFQKYIDNR
jgi:DNA-binding CsgD family transcriptional regulator